MLNLSLWSYPDCEALLVAPTLATASGAVNLCRAARPGVALGLLPIL
ncbi:MAG: hypothetical protein IH956_09395 [Chloroflexi bacterium]|nr:hypothetical protein [Chloroflexota bacterium]